MNLNFHNLGSCFLGCIKHVENSKSVKEIVAIACMFELRLDVIVWIWLLLGLLIQIEMFGFDDKILFQYTGIELLESEGAIPISEGYCFLLSLPF